jgi:hypothetical protein
MPKILRVRAALDEREEKQVRKLAGSRHGPADWIGACAYRGAQLGWGAGGSHRQGTAVQSPNGASSLAPL